MGALILATAGCSASHPDAGTAEDTTFAGADTTGQLTPDTTARAADSGASADAPVTAVATPVLSPAPAAPVPALSPAADSIGQFMVFDPTMQTWFLAAKRGKRLLVDIGRFDNDLRTKRQVAAYTEAVKALSPVPIGTPVRVYDAWGVEDDTVSGFDHWNGRIVATLHLSRQLDSLVRRASAVYAAVERIDTAHTDAPPNPDTAAAPDSAQRPAGASPTSGVRPPPAAAGPVTVSSPAPLRPSGEAHATGAASSPADSARRPDSAVCRRDSVPPPLLARAAVVRDSIDAWLRTLPPPPYDRLVTSERSVATQVLGCFGAGKRIALAVDLRAGADEWIRERAVLIDTLGKVSTLKVYDFRFKGHDFLSAIDPNGRHIDGIAARGVTQSAGGTVILSLEPGNRLTRWVAGFAWEDR